jgi:hypothetical protein
MPNNATVSHYNNLPGLYPEKFKVYIAPGQNYKTWKATQDISGNIFSQTVSRYSRPQTNLSVDSNYYSLGRHINNHKYVGSLNPLKQWRRQLAPAGSSSSNRASVSQAIDYPGGATHLERLTTTDCSSCAPLLTTYLKENPALNDCSNCTVIRNKLSNFQPVPLNYPQRIIRPRSSQTILKKNYYTTGAAYLRSRVKLYEQNQLLSAIPGNTYAPLGAGAGPGHDLSQYVPPSASITSGSQAFNSTYCVSDPSACCSTHLDGSFCAVYITYKPSNPVFSVQGAVSSSTRILNQKYKAIIRNNTNFWTPNGNKVNLTVNGEVLPGSTPIHYRGDTVAPYFIKSKYQRIDQCAPNGYKLSTHSRVRIDGRMPSGGTGIKTVCFPY